MPVRLLKVALFLAVACVATAPSPSYADTTITENLTLGADTDWRADGVVTVPQGVTVDLNGHTLWVSGLAGAGTFTSAVPDPSTFDLTTADASKVSSPTTFPSGISPANLFNNNYDRGQPTASNLNSRRIIVQNENLPIIVDYDFGAATSVNSYKVYAGGYRGGTSNQNSGHQRTAKHWKFYGSNDEGDDKAWTPLDERTVTDWNDKTAPDCKQFTFFNGTAYRHYRMEILEPQELSNGFTELVQLEYGHVPNQVRLDLSQSVGFAAASNTVSGTAKFVIGCGTASNNADLRGLGKVSMASNETFDIAGHYLKVHSIDGAGKVKTSNTSTFSDLTTPSAAKTCVTATSGGEVLVMAGKDKYPASAAFDNSTSSSTTGSAENPCHFAYYDSFPSAGIEINYDFGEATYVNRYRVFGSSASSFNVVPKSWAFEGSNDGGTTWTTLDTRTNQSLALNTWAEYTFESSESYSIYRLHTTAVNGSGKFYLFELEYGAVPYNKIYVEASGLEDSDISGIGISGVSMVVAEGSSGVLSGDLDLSGYSTISGTIDLNGHELWLNGLDGTGTITDSSSFDLTNPSGTVSSTNTFSSSTVAANAFCDAASYDSTHRVLANISTQSPIQIDYTFPAATVVNAYRVMSNGNSSSAGERAPKSIKFYGSNDGIEWTELDDRSHETGWVMNEMRQYEFTNETAYMRYRIEFYESKGGEIIEFFKLEYGNTGRCGRLHVAVPSGEKTNSGVALTGNLRLIKEGAGTLIASKTGQTYGGGTEIVGGVLKPGTGGSNHPFGSEGRDIVVRESAVLDAAGKVGFGKYEITLDGGTLKNTGTGAKTESNTQFRRVRLTKDSSLASESDMFFGVSDAEASTVYLGGHTLAVSIGAGKELRFYSMAILDGTFDITSGGYFVVGGNGGIVATNNVDFLANCALVAACPIKVDNYTAKWKSTTGKDTSINPINVYGTFTPATTHFHGVKMQDGSTIDLTGWSGGWPLASDLSAGVKDVLFASGATVKVDISGRTDLKALARSADPHLFTWPLEDGVPVRPGAEFVLDPATASAGFKVKKDATGLRLYGKGFMLIVK